MQKSGAKGTRQKEGNSRFLHTQHFNTGKGKALRNVQIDLGASSAGRLNTSSQQQQLSSPTNKLPFQSNAMSRMVTRDNDLHAYSSLDNKKVQKPLLRINLDDDASADKNERLELEAKERCELMKKDK